MATPGFYNAADQALYDQGNYFLPQEQYRLNLGTETGIPNRVEFNPSQNGIGSLQEPLYPYPYNNNEEGDGSPPLGPKNNYSYDSVFDPETQNKQFNEDIGVGTVAEEDDKKGTSLGIVDALRAMGAFTLGGPFNAMNSLRRSNNRNEQKEIDKINSDINAQYGYGTGAATESEMAGYEAPDGSYSGASTQDYSGGEKDGGFIDGTNRRPFNYGGLISLL